MEDSTGEAQVLDLVHVEEIRAMPGRQGGSLLHEFTALFLREEPKRMAELGRLAEAGDRPELIRLAHTLAGSCAMLGAPEMQRAALRVQAAGKSAPAAEITARLEDLTAAWKRLQEAMVQNKLMPPG